MKFGTGYIETGTSGAASREFATALDEAGFDFVTTSGHVLSAEPDRYEDRPNALYVGPFRDPMVLFSHMAAATERLHFRTSILILPAFPVALVARQAAELQELSGGRFELGVGISWHEAEYRALGQDLHTRGRRMEEQIELLRRFWSSSKVASTRSTTSASTASPRTRSRSGSAAAPRNPCSDASPASPTAGSPSAPSSSSGQPSAATSSRPAATSPPSASAAVSSPATAAPTPGSPRPGGSRSSAPPTSRSPPPASPRRTPSSA
jgi:alkanesulfonate monooxygenase SsuD/methylene tetrahydromethanopterin reductase-like flavin-dependent oxidoreductase (luciferase family)